VQSSLWIREAFLVLACIPLFMIGLWGLLSRRPRLLPMRWWTVSIGVAFIPFPLLVWTISRSPLASHSRPGHEFLPLIPLAGYLLCYFIFLWISQLGYVVFGINQASFRSAFQYAMTQLGLGFEERSSTVVVPSEGLELHVKSGFGGVNSLYVKRPNGRSRLNDIALLMNEYFVNNNVVAARTPFVLFVTLSLFIFIGAYQASAIDWSSSSDYEPKWASFKLSDTDINIFLEENSSLKLNEVQPVVRANSESVIHSCWYRFDGPSLSVETTKVHLTIGAQGSIEKIREISDIPSVGTCVEDAVRGWSFPPSTGSTTAHFSFDFYPPERAAYFKVSNTGIRTFMDEHSSLRLNEFQPIVRANSESVIHACWDGIAGWKYPFEDWKFTSVELTIGPQGSIEKIGVNSDIPSVDKCVEDAIRGWSFSRSTGSTSANLRFFRPFVDPGQEGGTE